MKQEANDLEDMNQFEKLRVRPAWFSSDDLVWVLLPSWLKLMPAVSWMVNWLAHKMLSSPSFSLWFTQSPLISLFFILNSGITSEHKVKSFLPILPCHDQQLTLSTAYTEYGMNQVQHTPSTAYTEYGLYQVQHTPSTAYNKHSIYSVLHTLNTAYTVYCTMQRSTVSCSQTVSHLSADYLLLNSSHSHNYRLTNEWSLRSHPGSLLNYQLPMDRHQVLLHSCSIMTSKCISKLNCSQPASISPKWLNYSLHVRKMAASKRITKLAQSRPPCVSLTALNYSLQARTLMAFKCMSLNSLNHGLQVQLQNLLIMILECKSKFTPSWPPCVSANWHHEGLQVRSITASNCISELTQSRTWSASLSSVDPGLHVYLQTHSITASRWISKLAPSRHGSVSLSPPDSGVVNWWSWRADSTLSALCHTSPGLQKEFLSKRGYCSRIITRGGENITSYPPMMNQTHCVDRWTYGNSV